MSTAAQKRMSITELVRNVRRAVIKWLNEGRNELAYLVNHQGANVHIVFGRNQEGQAIKYVPSLTNIEKVEIDTFIQKLVADFGLTLKRMVDKGTTMVCSLYPAT